MSKLSRPAVLGNDRPRQALSRIALVTIPVARKLAMAFISGSVCAG